MVEGTDRILCYSTLIPSRGYDYEHLPTFLHHLSSSILFISVVMSSLQAMKYGTCTSTVQYAEECKTEKDYSDGWTDGRFNVVRLWTHSASTWHQQRIPQIATKTTTTKARSSRSRPHYYRRQQTKNSK